jgi:hypothetical protein
MKKQLQFCFAGVSAGVLDLAEAFSLLALWDVLIDLYDRFRGRINWNILATIKTDVFWLGTAAGFFAGFMLMMVWPEGIAILAAFVIGMLKGPGAA